jgi:hypothetical protein
MRATDGRVLTGLRAGAERDEDLSAEAPEAAAPSPPPGPAAPAPSPRSARALRRHPRRRRRSGQQRYAERASAVSAAIARGGSTAVPGTFSVVGRSHAVARFLVEAGRFLMEVRGSLVPVC